MATWQLHGDAVVVMLLGAVEGDETAVTASANYPEQTGLSYDLYRPILVFVLCITRGGMSRSPLASSDES